MKLKGLLTNSYLTHLHHCPLTSNPVWSLESFKDVSGELKDNNKVFPLDCFAISKEKLLTLARKLGDVAFIADVLEELESAGKTIRYWTNGHEFLANTHRQYLKFTWVGDTDTLPKVELKVIAAMDSASLVIGDDNKLPWKLKGDLAHFSRTTKNSLVIVGRKTLESMGGRLPERGHIVMSRQIDAESTHGLTHSPSTNNTIRLAKIISTVLYDSKPVWVIGGGVIYELLVPYVDELILTKVEAGGISGDTKFPLSAYTSAGFVESETLTTVEKDERNDHNFSIVKMIKKAK